MRKISIVFYVLVFTSLIYSQNASDYFPANTGFKWYYKNVPLDSLNNEIDSATTVEIDSFAAATVSYKGRSADLILGKQGLESTILYQPYTDSAFVSFDGSNAYTYFKGVDFAIPGTSQNVLGKRLSNLATQGLVDWQLFYQFSAAVNTSYSIFSVDTVLNLNSTNYNFRIVGTGMRLGNENITTEAGNYDAEKFLINTDIQIFFITQYVSILTISDTTWIAQGKWFVKSVVPSVSVSGIPGVASFYVPGYKSETINPIVTAIKGKQNFITDFHLYQNYPNPFNPSTTIKYSLPEASKVKLVVYNILGKEITTLVNGFQTSGIHAVEFNPSKIDGGLPSGIYFYRIEANNRFAVKKLIYLK